ncbi:hypothetical protein HJC23_004911 [Cyclotella cryptica]|uniref:Uncharacterized protein n=1 Tax=Cyclotella cryptica TaxID=29204 RepID=A0ABD3PS49_9STRA
MILAKRHLSVAFFAKLLRVTLALSNPIQLKPTAAQALQVWDDVLPRKDQRQTLHDFASKTGLGHSCFSRPLQNRVGRNVIELTLDAILTEIERSTIKDAVNSEQNTTKVKRQYVEYWSRQEWRHIGE